MYWWRIRDLRTELVNATLPERARFQYLLVFVVLSAIAVDLPLGPSEPNNWDRASAIVAISSAILGTIWLYRVNGGDRGHSFLERYLSLGWVFLLRFLVASVPVVGVAYLAGGFAGIVTNGTGLFDVVVMIIWNAAFLIGLRYQFGQVVAAEDALQQGAKVVE